ncbi:MAG: plasmid partitioning protein RepB C-terminal domain-containing protein [Paraburkholderia sp.]
MNTVKRRASLLDGISREAASLLADKNCPATTFNTLKLMNPMRQLEAVELMCGQGNFTSAFARAILAATPQTQLEERPGASRSSRNELTAQLGKLERELAVLQANVTQTDERYGIEHLHLTVSTAYIATLMGNENVSRWMTNRHPELALQLETISRESSEARATDKPMVRRLKGIGELSANPIQLAGTTLECRHR